MELLSIKGLNVVGIFFKHYSHQKEKKSNE